MATKIGRTLLLAVIAVSCMYSTCKKGIGGCADTVYSFQISESIIPDGDSLRIGDTLHLRMNTSTNLIDLQSGEAVDYSNASNLGNVITLLKFSPDNQTPGAVNSFDLNVIKGKKISSPDPTSEQEVLFAEENGSYVFDMVVIPKDTGRYVLTIGNAANVYRQNDECTKAGFAINFESTNQHFYYLELWRPDLTLDESGKKKVYYFKVY